MQRFASVIGLKAEKVEDYKRLHASIWPEVARMIAKSNLRNYSIFLRRMPDGSHYLFSYFEYVGSDFNADMAQMAADPATQRWWSYCEPCQVPLTNRLASEWWSSMEEVFHQS